MSGTVVNCTHLDSIRVEVLGESRAILIPAALVLAVDRVLRQCLVEGEGLSVDPVDRLDAPWEATIGFEKFGHGTTPWEAVLKLAEQYDRRPA